MVVSYIDDFFYQKVGTILIIFYFENCHCFLNLSLYTYIDVIFNQKVGTTLNYFQKKIING